VSNTLPALPGAHPPQRLSYLAGNIWKTSLLLPSRSSTPRLDEHPLPCGKLGCRILCEPQLCTGILLATPCAFSPTSVSALRLLFLVDPIQIPPAPSPTIISRELRNIAKKPCGENCFLLQPLDFAVHHVFPIYAAVIADTIMFLSSLPLPGVQMTLKCYGASWILHPTPSRVIWQQSAVNHVKRWIVHRSSLFW
jgi:hypothetical protein